MPNTIFIEPFTKHLLIQELKNGNDKAEELIHQEFDRLENRIKSLELGLSVSLDKFNMIKPSNSLDISNVVGRKSIKS